MYIIKNLMKNIETYIYSKKQQPKKFKRPPPIITKFEPLYASEREMIRIIKRKFGEDYVPKRVIFNTEAKYMEELKKVFLRADI